MKCQITQISTPFWIFCRMTTYSNLVMTLQIKKLKFIHNVNGVRSRAIIVKLSNNTQHHIDIQAM